MKTLYSLILVLFISTPSMAQVDAYSEDVKTCIKNNGTYNYYADVVDQMFGMLKKQYASKNVPTSVWSDLEKIKPEAMDELSQMMVSAYKGHYNHNDVKKMNALYASPAGKTMVSNSENLTENDKKKLSKFYESETGQTILQSQESMNATMSKISEMWSSDMYRKVVSQLSEKGFTLEQ